MSKHQIPLNPYRDKYLNPPWYTNLFNKLKSEITSCASFIYLVLVPISLLVVIAIKEREIEQLELQNTSLTAQNSILIKNVTYPKSVILIAQDLDSLYEQTSQVQKELALLRESKLRKDFTK